MQGGVRPVLRVLHEVVQVDDGAAAAADEADVPHRTDTGGAARGGQGVERRVQCRDGEAAGRAHLAVDVDGKGAGCGDGDGYLVGTEGVVAGEVVADGRAGLRKGHALEEDPVGSLGLYGAVGTDALVYLLLAVAEDGDVHLVALAKDVRVGSLRPVGGAEHVERLVGEQGVAVDVGVVGLGVLGLEDANLGLCLGLLDGGLGYLVGRYRGGKHCRRGGSGVLRPLLGLHGVKDGDDTAAVVLVLRGGDVVDVDALLEEAGTHLGLVKAAPVDLALGERQHGGRLPHDEQGQHQQQCRKKSESLHILFL